MSFKHIHYLKMEQIAINKMEFIYQKTLSRQFKRAEKLKSIYQKGPFQNPAH